MSQDPAIGSKWRTATNIEITVDRISNGTVYHHCVIERGARKGERLTMECTIAEWEASVRCGQLSNQPPAKA